jgi:hypothetical protein
MMQINQDQNPEWGTSYKGQYSQNSLVKIFNVRREKLKKYYIFPRPIELLRFLAAQETR